MELELELSSVLSDDSVTGNYVIGRGRFYHAYPASSSDGAPYTAFFMGGDRDSIYQNNAGGRYRLEAEVLLTVFNRSPVLRMLPVMPLVKSGLTEVTFTIPGYDPDPDDSSDLLTFSLGTPAQRGGLTNYTAIKNANDAISDVLGTDLFQSPTQLPGLLLNSKTGVVTMPVTNLVDGFYQLSVSLRDSHVSVSADLTLYLLSNAPSFCAKDCLDNEAGVLTAMDSDGLYDG
jgi:hypothetical protein